MSLLCGRGPEPFLRLQLEILSNTDNDSILAWDDPYRGWSPRLFQGSGGVFTTTFDSERPPSTMTNRGLGLAALTVLSPNNYELVSGEELENRVLAPFNCKCIPPVTTGPEPDISVALVLFRDNENKIEAPTEKRRQPLIRTIDWRIQVCQVLKLRSNPYTKRSLNLSRMWP